MHGTHRSLVADPTLDHMLVGLALYGDKALAYSATDDRGTAALRGGEGGVRRGILPQGHRGLGGTGERREA